MWIQFTCALSFLTILRIPSSLPTRVTSADLAHSTSFFPLVGLIVGACTLLPAYALSPWMPPLLLAVILTAILTILTRGLHLDGLADLVDGVGGGYTPQKRLQIMKDSRTGAFGALALVLAILFKVAAIHTLVLDACWTPFLIVPTLSRFAMVLAAYKSPYARPEGGLARPFLEKMSRRELLIASILAAAITLPMARLDTLAYAPPLFFFPALLRRVSRNWLGGITGDVLGAVNEITEIALFALAACLSGR